MAHPDRLDPADALVAQVARSVGGLTPDEHFAIYGAASGYLALVAAGASAEHATPAVGSVVLALRSAPCRWCGGGLAQHDLQMLDFGASVRCHTSDRSLPAVQWLAGPAPIAPWRRALAILGWVGLPLLSLGLFSWVMPTIGAIARRRAQWALAAAVSLTALIVALNLPESANGISGTLVFLNWIGPAIYGGFQVGPWLRESAGR